MNRRSLLCGAALVALGWSAGASAQEFGLTECAPTEEGGVCLRERAAPIVVTASRSDDVQVSDYTGSVTFINADDLEKRQTRNIEDVLRDVPSVAVSTVAGQTQLRLRGSEANHVLVLVDGIEVSDPFAGEFDVGTLQAEIGSRVEVLLGPQSALYGSDAIGGVVAYDSGQFEGISAFVEGGTNDTLNGAVRVGTRGGGYSASLSAIVVSTDGEPNAIDGVRDIGRDSYTIAGKGSIELAPDFKVRGVGRFVRTEGDFNDQDFDPSSPTFGFVIDSPGTRFENDAIYGLVGARLDTLRGRWTHDVSVQIADIARDTFGPFGRTSGSDGDRLKASYVSSLGWGRFGGEHSLTFAADWERERFRNDDPFGFASDERQQIENVGLVGEYRYAGDRFDFSAALRHDINDRFADETTFRVGAGFKVTDDTRLRASAGSGIRNPGFFELFGFFDGVFIGNEDLEPEKSTGWEVGLDHTFANGDATLSLTYFDSTLEDEIFTTFSPPTFVPTPANSTAESDRRGIEVAVAAELGKGFTFNGAYSFLDAEEDGVEEVRRPDHIASASLNWRSDDDRFGANLTARYNGDAEDLAFTDPSFIPVRVTLDDYVLVNLNARYRLSDRFELFGRVENLLDERFEQVFSFISPGITAAAGIRADF